MDVVIEMVRAHAETVAAFAVAALIAWLKRELDMRGIKRDKQHANEMAALDLETQRLAIEQELLAERKKRTVGRATPTGLRHATVKASASQSFPAVTDAMLDESIKRGAKAAGTLVKKIAPSIMPTARESAEHALNLPPLDDLPRPTATVEGFGEIDVADIADAHEVDE